MPPKATTHPNQSGLCQCGCGQPTRIARATNRKLGIVAGQPLRYLHGHNRRVSGPAYVIDPATGCWVWQKQLSEKGYAHIKIGRDYHRAHRVFYERHRGPIPEGCEPDHLCRNRACVNPDHIELVSHQVNAQRSSSTKLSADDVRTIRRLAASYTYTAIAKRYGVGRNTIARAVSGKSWTNVK